jgi:hypothetical protein
MSWTKKIVLRHLLTGETSAEAIKALANGAIEAVKNSDAPIAMFKKALALADKDEEVALVVVNDAMNKLYDWADDNRVWVG